MTLRSTTNLIVPEDLVLSKAELKSGFMYVYTKSTAKGTGKYNGLIFMNRLWMSTIFPQITDDPTFGKDFKKLAEFTKEGPGASVHAGYLKIQKINEADDPHFIVSVPLAEFNHNNLELSANEYRRYFTKSSTFSEEFNNSIEGLKTRLIESVDAVKPIESSYSAATIIGNMKEIETVGKIALQQSLIRIRFVSKGSITVVFADFKISKEASQLLSTTEWLQIRPVDIYPLLLQWVAGQFGTAGVVPLAAFPLSKIARTLPPVIEGQTRINDKNLSINGKGEPQWLPEKLNDTARYEDLYTQLCAKDDGSFGLLDLDTTADILAAGGKIKVSLPTNIPVLIDWLNNKYAYTNSSGMLTVLDLSRFKAADPVHIRNLLMNIVLEDSIMAQIFLMAKTAGVEPNIFVRSDELELIAEMDASVANRLAPQGGHIAVDKYYETAANFFVIHYKDRILLKDISTKGEPIWRALSRYFIQVHAAVIANIEAVNLKYAVSTVTDNLGWLTLLACYASEYASLDLESNKLCAAALAQDVTANWQPPSIPMLSNKIGLLPHQKKVRNLMKDSPDFAILPVQAGGGKCLGFDTLITTKSDGIIRIGDVFEDYHGSEIAGHKDYFRLDSPLSVVSTDGELTEVEHLFRSKGKLWSLELADGTMYDALKEHRFWTQHGWKHVKKLTTNDYILNQPPTEFNTKSYKFKDYDFIADAIAIYSHCSHNRTESLSYTTIPTKMTRALAFILGALVAEGHEGVFCNTDEDFLSLYEEAFKKVFGVSPVRSSDSRNNDIRLVAPNIAVKNFLFSIIAKEARSAYHRIPRCVLASKKEHQIMFLKAYFEGDGYVSGIEGRTDKIGNISCTTISKDLQQEIFQLLKNLGFYPNAGGSSRARKNWKTISGEDGKSTKHVAYEISIPRCQSQQFFDTIGFASDRKNLFLQKVLAAHDDQDKFQDSNFTSQGWHNQLPTASLVKKFIKVLEDNLDPSAFKLNTGTAIYPIKFKQCLSYALTNSYNPYPVIEDAKTRYAVDMLLSVVDGDRRIKEAVDNSIELQDLLAQIIDIKSRVWARVDIIKKDVKHAFVYDLVLPTTRAYVANGYLSHNTPLLIIDILYEIKANRNEPYLLLCPAHLVAQYVKEIVFFTAGKLNVVPINSYVVDHNGFNRLTKLLDGAPRNTVVVANYDALRGQGYDVCYGTSTTTVYPVIEFLRQFKFGYVGCDESHYIKNDSQRSRCVAQLIADIPKKRLASGTMAHDSPSDLAVQLGLLDPTLFGDRPSFNARYGAVVNGDRVSKWKPGAQAAIMAMIKTRVVVAGAMRKEWAALLPHINEQFLRVHMTDAQQLIYDKVFDEVMAEIEDAAKGNAALTEFLTGGGKTINTKDLNLDADDVDTKTDNAVDENEGAGIENALKFMLQRLEQFLTAPTKDPAGAQLTGDDAISPKVNMIIHQIREHLDAKIVGKILIFTNWIESAEAIYEAFPPDIKRQALLYVAADKESTGARFENDPNMKIMVGVENSMNTGLNLQFVSRLIRIETVWNPGTLEQGNSRVNRPELKKADRRDEIYYDWIVADKTIDITKISRLISKVIAIAKFENPLDPAYQDIPDVDVVPMNKDTIAVLNNWDTNLGPYYEAYKKYKQVQYNDYADYKKEHGELIDAAGNVDLELLPVAPTPADAKMMLQVPYTPGLDLYKQGDLGLVRMDEFLRLNEGGAAEEEGKATDDEAEDNEDTEGAGNVKKQRLLDLWKTLIGQAVHTEHGDGIVRSVSPINKWVTIVLYSGETVTRVHIASAFVITRKTTSTKDIRNQILKQIGEMPITTPIDITLAPRVNLSTKAEKERIEKEKLRIEEEQKKKAEKVTAVELQFDVSNGFLGLSHYVDKKNPDATNALIALGFRPTPKFVVAQVHNVKQLLGQFAAWKKAGFSLDPDTVKYNTVPAFQDLSRLMKSGKIASGSEVYKYSTKNQLKNFFRMEVKPSTSHDLIKPFPLVEDGMAYIAMYTRGQPAAIAATKIKYPGIRWQHAEESIVFYGLDHMTTIKKLKEVEAAGIEISNIADLVTQYNGKLRKTNLRNGKEASKEFNELPRKTSKPEPEVKVKPVTKPVAPVKKPTKPVAPVKKVKPVPKPVHKPVAPVKKPAKPSPKPGGGAFDPSLFK